MARRTDAVAIAASIFRRVTIDESADSGKASEFPAIAPVAEVFGRPDVTLQALSNYSTAFGVGLTLFLPWGVAGRAFVLSTIDEDRPITIAYDNHNMRTIWRRSSSS